MKYISSLFFLTFIFYGCTQSDYTKLVKAELGKDVRQDSLLLGISFGDTRDEFFGRCFDLNKLHLVSQGPNNASVKYIFKDSIFHNEPTEIRLLFYPSFDDKGLISDMDLEFSYMAWAPWNRKLQSDSLAVKVKKILLDWYKGNEFVIAHIDEEEIPVKLDGNRRLTLIMKDDQSVIVRIQDILHPKFMHSISK